jgi:hypothetical protein
MKRLVAFIAVALLVFFIITQPETAATRQGHRSRAGQHLLRGSRLAAVLAPTDARRA